MSIQNYSFSLGYQRLFQNSDMTAAMQEYGSSSPATKTKTLGVFTLRLKTAVPSWPARSVEMCYLDG